MPQCMDKYKNDFAIEFAKLMQKNSQKWKKVQHDARLELLSPSSFGYYLLSLHLQKIIMLCMIRAGFVQGNI